MTRRRSSTGVRSAPPPNHWLVVTTMRVFICTAGTLGFTGWAISEMPDAQKRGSDSAPGIWLRNSGANSPCTVETWTPTFSNTRPRMIAMVPPPVSAWSVEMPYMATAVAAMPQASGMRGPSFVIRTPASGEATIITPGLDVDGDFSDQFGIPAAIGAEAGLALLGLGVDPSIPSWGTMISEGTRYLLSAPHMLLFPATMFALTLLAFTWVGDGLRDAFDASGDLR